jgi:hypothetical protein
MLAVANNRSAAIKQTVPTWPFGVMIFICRRSFLASGSVFANATGQPDSAPPKRRGQLSRRAQQAWRTRQPGMRVSAKLTLASSIDALASSLTCWHQLGDRQPFLSCSSFRSARLQSRKITNLTYTQTTTCVQRSALALVHELTDPEDINWERLPRSKSRLPVTSLAQRHLAPWRQSGPIEKPGRAEIVPRPTAVCVTRF